jgi:hypothetical protein
MMALFIVLIAVAMAIRMVAVVFGWQLGNYVAVANPQRERDLWSDDTLVTALRHVRYIWSHQDDSDPALRRLRKRAQIADVCSWSAVLLAIASGVVASVRS